MKGKPWPLPRVLERDRNAATVFLALVALAGGRRQLGTSRGRIRELCGLSLRRIGSAVAALHEAKWLFRRYGSEGVKLYFWITLPSIDLAAIVGFRPVVRKSTHREKKRRSENNSPGGRRGVPENVPYSVGVGPSGPPARRPSVPDPTGEIERQRLAEIRTRRLESAVKPV